MLIGNGEERTEVEAARQLARVDGGGGLGGEDRADPQPVPPHRRARLDPGAEAGRGLRRVGLRAGWSRGCAGRASRSSRSRPPTRSSSESTRSRSGGERVISTAGSAKLNEQMRGLGLEVFDPDLSMFTRGGGGAHCLAQALDRDPGYDAVAAGAIDSARVIADLRELARRTSDEHGAQRLCWSPIWRRARASFGELLGRARSSKAESTRRATSGRGSRAPIRRRPRWRSAPTSTRVPDGGWLDGALGVMAGRSASCAPGRNGGEPAAAAAGAGRLGRRGGRALRPQPVRQLGLRRDARPAGARGAARRRGSARSPRCWPRTGSSSPAAGECAARRQGLGAYLELHIEQGPRDGGRGPAGGGGHRLRRARAAAASPSSGRRRTPARPR